MSDKDDAFGVSPRDYLDDEAISSPDRFKPLRLYVNVFKCYVHVTLNISYLVVYK